MHGRTLKIGLIRKLRKNRKISSLDRDSSTGLEEVLPKLKEKLREEKFRGYATLEKNQANVSLG